MNRPRFAKTPFLVVALSMALLPGLRAARADENAKGKEAEVKIPATYMEAVGAIEARSKAIAKLIETKKLDGIHVEAAAIKKIADAMPKLVAKEGSGVPKDAYKEVLQASKALSGMFPKLDEAGDSGNLAESQKLHAMVLDHVAVLKKHTKH